MYTHKEVNKDFFKRWSNDMAYILGFFAADGYITVNRRGGQYWAFHIAEKDLLHDIRKKIKSNHTIGIRKREKINSVTYRLQIGSNEMCEDLRKLGFDKNKTKRLSVPNIPDKYFSHFVRGYFDGDGNVWLGWVHKSRKTNTYVIQTVFTSCSFDFLEKLRLKLETFGVQKGTIRQGKGNYFRLVYSVNNSLKLSYFMYNGLRGTDLFLKRKRDRFQKFIKMRL